MIFTFLSIKLFFIEIIKKVIFNYFLRGTHKRKRNIK
jgi:hypothetical protein